MSEKEFKCDICVKTYATYKTLWDHNKRKHTTKATAITKDVKSTATFICRICGKCYKHKQSRYFHEKSCSGVPQAISTLELEKYRSINLDKEAEVLKLKLELKNGVVAKKIRDGVPPVNIVLELKQPSQETELKNSVVSKNSHDDVPIVNSVLELKNSFVHINDEQKPAGLINTFDIVSLIEDKNVCNLSNDYNNKLLIKIKEQFTENQQQLFVASFYCYLKYNQTADFVVDLDKVWEWIGFGTKADAKRVLTKNFTLDKDYKIVLRRLAEQGKHSNGGNNKETVLMTVKTFKLFCIKSNTKKANEIHEYYIKLEELLQETIREESSELRLQLQEKREELEKMTGEKDWLREQTILEQIPNNTQCIYYGYIDNTNDQNEKLVKFGQTNSLTRRIAEHKKLFLNFRLINAFRVENKQIIENEIKKYITINKLRRTILIDKVNHSELFAINDINITELNKHIKNIIVSNEFTPEKFLSLTKENEKLTAEILSLKEAKNNHNK